MEHIGWPKAINLLSKLGHSSCLSATGEIDDFCAQIFRAYVRCGDSSPHARRGRSGYGGSRGPGRGAVLDTGREWPAVRHGRHLGQRHLGRRPRPGRLADHALERHGLVQLVARRQSLFEGVAATSASNAWSVGGTDWSSPATLIYHWDGSTWTRQASPNPGGGGFLNGVAAASATDAWAVGLVGGGPGAGTGPSDKTLIEHWNGTAWTTVPSPTPAPAGALERVAVVSPSDAWAVGWTGNGTSDFNALIEHWDGKSWNVVPGAGLGRCRHRPQCGDRHLGQQRLGGRRHHDQPAPRRHPALERHHLAEGRRPLPYREPAGRIGQFA